jgi:penicillin G amidase
MKKHGGKRSMFKKIIIGILTLLIVVVLAAFGYFYYLINRAVPDYDARITLNGLTDEVTVYRDKYAIPHIYAKNESDLYRAVGYCMAQDRLFQMDMIRRLTSGRLSEIVGEKAVDLDHLMRALRISEKSRKIYKNTDKNITRTADAFSDGVNQFIEKNKNRLPIEFTILGYKPEKWLPEHSFNVIGYFSFDLSTAWDTEIFFHEALGKVGKEKLREIMPDIPAETESIFPGFDGELTELDLRGALASAGRLIEEMGLTIFHGSNNWAVSGEKTATGKPLFANDMHLGLNIPGIWYQMHHAVEGEFDVTGVMAPGQPFIVAGHNEHIAWGFTNVMLDDMDFYLERVNPDSRDEYEFNGEWKKMKVARETIRLKGGGEVQKEIRYTHRGPVISEIKKITDKVISMRWIGNEDSNEVRSLYLLNRARNKEEFKNAMRTFRSVSQNTAYADTEGNIGLYCAAGIPLREKGDGTSVVPGWTDEYDWKGLVPFEEQPHVFNPEKNYISSANNKTVGNEYPHYISTWYAPDYRFRRINELLDEKEKITIDDMRAMHADFKSKLAEDLLPDLVESLEKAGNLNALEAGCLDILKSWDGVMDKNEAAPAVFDAFYLKFTENLFGDELGDELLGQFMSKNYMVNYAVKRLWKDRSSVWFDDVTTGGKREGFDDIVQAGFRESVKWLSGEWGDDPSGWRWGDMHQLLLEHPLAAVDILDRILKLNRGPYPVSGSYHTVCPYQYKMSDPFDVDHGASHRHIYCLADWDDSLTVIPTGTSGVPASRYYCDQTELYINNEYHPDYLSWRLIEGNARYVSRISAP